MSFADSHHSEAKNQSIIPDTTLLERKFDHVMCFGTFDIFHPGHEYYLREAHRYAHHMTIVIARDHRVFSGKGRDPLHSEQVRMQKVMDSFPQAEVILGDERDIFAPIRSLRPDLLAFGYDQRVPEEKIRELFPSIHLIRIGGHEVEKWKSSLLRRNEKGRMKNE